MVPEHKLVIENLVVLALEEKISKKKQFNYLKMDCWRRWK